MLLAGALLCMFGMDTYAQDDLLNMMDEEDGDLKTPVTATFKTTRVISAHSVECLDKGVLDFRITHRFGNIGGASGGGIHTLYGLDNASNIRLALELGINDRLMVGVGRSKMNEHIDGFLKWSWLQQMEGKGMPVSVVLLSTAALNPSADPQAIWKVFAHRLSYVHQLIIARKFNPSFSAEVLPSFIHRNFVRAWDHPDNGGQDENDMWSLGAAFRLKISKRSAVVAEYHQVFSQFRQGNSVYPFYQPLAIGYEIETGGHVFHVNFSNTGGIIENDFLVSSPDSWAKGGIKLGFTISRVFQVY